MNDTLNENPLIPMGALTGRPNREAIHAFLHAFRKVGFSQYLIYPRSGCELEYLSDEWFDTCAAFLEECENLGYTSVWLYDEFNFPSGQCGGRIMKEKPDHALHFLQVFEKDGVFSYGITSNPNAPDVLNPEVTRKFIAYTHERYAERFGKYFGSLIKGIFTDEPSFNYYVGVGTGEEKLLIPFYPELEADYAALTGSTLKQDLKFCIRNRSPRFWEPFVGKLLGKRFLNAFILPIRDWCDRHGLLMTGHLLREGNLENSLGASGTPMEATDAFSLPAVDEIYTASSLRDAEWITFGTAEHAIRKNGNGGLAELFALGPCDMSLARIRRQIRFASMFGFDHYVLAVSPMDMRGNSAAKMSCYFNCFSPALPWFPAFEVLGEDSRVAAAVAHRQFVPEIQIRRPSAGVPLEELLIQLAHVQRQWTLIGEDEEGTSPVVIHLAPEGIVPEKMPDGTRFGWSNFATFFRKLDEILPRKAAVTEPDGSLARDLFLRTYADGSTEILNFSPSRETRRLSLNRNTSRISFELAPDGVCSFGSLRTELDRPDLKRPVFDGVRSFGPWRVELDRPNLKRLAFENGVCRFKLNSALDGLVFLLRLHKVPVTLEMGGVPITAEERSDILPEGFRGLYAATSPFRLDAGEYTLKMTGDFPEYPYLPSVFLAGKFAAFGDTLAEYGKDGAGLENYVGKIIQIGEVEIPRDAHHLRLETDELYTALYLDGKKMPERLWAPFVWEIPETLAGKVVSMRIERYTSCGPMFGRERFDHPRPEDQARRLAGFRPSEMIRHPVIEPEFLS